MTTRTMLLGWIDDERCMYADLKNDEESEIGKANIEAIRREALDRNGRYDAILMNYYGRAQMLDVRTPAGRQAFGKLLTTMLWFLEHVIEEHGPMPEPGLPSGDVRPWTGGIRSRGMPGG